MSEIKKITLFKIKPGRDFADFLRGDLTAFDHITDDQGAFEGYIKYQSAGGAEKTEEQIPWLRFLNSGFEAKKYVFSARNKFPRAIMALKISPAEGEPVYYVASFGQHGDSDLDKIHVAYDFGIKVGMNICDVEGLRRIQTTAHESISKQTERQASTGTNLGVFGINTDSEFLRTISGNVKADYRDIIESFKGKDSILIKLPKERDISWADLATICLRLEERYASEDYKATEFRVYDTLRLENDPLVIEALDQALCERIVARDFAKIHLAPPEFVEDDELSYAFKARGEGDPPPVFEDLRIAELISVPRRRLANLTADTIKRWPIFQYDAEQDQTHQQWTAYRCLVAEVDLGAKTFVLSNGQWREVSEELKAKVTRYFEDHDTSVEAPYLPEGISIYSTERAQNREEVYNNQAATDCAELYLLDKAKVAIAGQRQYEICDLLHLDKHIVHVKRYSSGAASISHLFTQGKFYAHAFSTDETCRLGMCEWIDADVGAINAVKSKVDFKAIIPEKTADLDEKDYTVIFCVLHDRQGFSVVDLPFMSQYELMLSHKFLTEDRRFKVGVVFRSVELNAA